MVKAQVVHGADISHHQDNVDLRKAKAAGLQFLYHKATEGTNYVDPEFGKRRAAAKAAGLPFGGYHFARPDRTARDARAEARRFIAIVDPQPGDLRPALDLEVQTSGVNLNNWARDFLDEVKKISGLACVVYSPFNLQAFAGHTMWVPRYNTNNTPPVQPWHIWQFSNGIFGVPDSFPGLGHVDLNTLHPGVTVGSLLIPRKETKPVTPINHGSRVDPFILRLQHSSMQRTDSKTEKIQDARKVFSTGNHVISFTEVGVGENPFGRDALKAAAKAAGYTLHMDRFGCGVAVRIPGATVLGKGYDGPILKGVAGDHPHIGLCWLTIQHPQIGEATFGAMHWLTRDNEPTRNAKNDWLSEQATTFLERKASGNRIAFIAGDTNEDDNGQRIFPKSAPWTTIWDEIHKYPDTLDNRTVDIIASYDLDARVHAVGGRVMPLGLHSDHRTVEAVYRVGAVK